MVKFLSKFRRRGIKRAELIQFALPNLWFSSISYMPVTSSWAIVFWAERFLSTDLTWSHIPWVFPVIHRLHEKLASKEANQWKKWNHIRFFTNGKLCGILCVDTLIENFPLSTDLSAEQMLTCSLIKYVSEDVCLHAHTVTMTCSTRRQIGYTK